MAQKCKIQIRYNTEKDKRDHSLPAWRVLVDGKEFLAESISIKTDSWTSMDEIAPGVIKWHITTEGICSWDTEKKKCEIKS
jgi:hypothetical protein